MNAIILTDYKNVGRTMDMCVKFNAKINDEMAYIIVDNSAEEFGRKHLENNSIPYTSGSFGEKKVYTFNYDGIDFVMIDNNANAGYARGNNVGAAYAREVFKSEYYIFSNSDLAFPYEMDLSLITKTLREHPDVGIIGPNILYKGESKQNPRKFMGIGSQMILGDFNSRWFHCKYNYKYNCLDGNAGEGKTDWVTGCFMIIDAAKFHEVGGFDEYTFLYGEEKIISRRMLNKGYITYYLPSITLIHDHSGVDNYKLRKVLHKSLRYYYKTYEKTNFFLLVLSDIAFYVSEFGYFLYHDILKVKILKKG